MSLLPPAYLGLEPAEVWRHFSALNAIPRPSGHEEAAMAYVQHVAVSQGARYQTDARGNIVVRVGARGEGSSSDDATLVMQSHLDMVCQKRPDVRINFETDPITPRREGDQIFATGTTLGADNGLGAALMLAVLTSPHLTHPPLELLFTVEEETGLFGAAHLDPDLVEGRLMVNLDSEDPDEVTIGCAGGATTTLLVPTQRDAVAADMTAYRLTLGGLQGGHSGIQIGEPLANAIKVVGETLDALSAAAPGLRLVSLEGGTAHNAIPRDCVAQFVAPTAQSDALGSAFETVKQKLQAQWSVDEPNFVLKLEAETAPTTALNTDSTATMLRLIRELPHGVAKMSERYAGKVQTSSNLAEVKSDDTGWEWNISNRSFLASDMDNMQAKCAAIGHAANAEVISRDGYPGWEPRADSALQTKTVAAFVAATGHTPKVEVVHAGLECGILSEKLPGLDAVSFGPLIRGAHTPEEWCSISSVDVIWRVLTQLLASLTSAS